MEQTVRICTSVGEFVETIQALQPVDYTSHFNLDGTWTIRFRAKTNSGWDVL